MVSHQRFRPSPPVIDLESTCPIPQQQSALIMYEFLVCTGVCTLANETHVIVCGSCTGYEYIINSILPPCGQDWPRLGWSRCLLPSVKLRTWIGKLPRIASPSPHPRLTLTCLPSFLRPTEKKKKGTTTTTHLGCCLEHSIIPFHHSTGVSRITTRSSQLKPFRFMLAGACGAPVVIRTTVVCPRCTWVVPPRACGPMIPRTLFLAAIGAYSGRFSCQAHPRQISRGRRQTRRESHVCSIATALGSSTPKRHDAMCSRSVASLLGSLAAWLTESQPAG